MNLLILTLIISTSQPPEFALDKGSKLFNVLVSFEALPQKGEGIFSQFYANINSEYFTTSNFSIGGGLSYISSSSENSVMSIFSLGPNVSYFWGKKESKIYPYLSCGADFVAIERFDIFGLAPKLALGAVSMVSPYHGFGIEAGYKPTFVFEEGTNAEKTPLHLFYLGVNVIGFLY